MACSRVNFTFCKYVLFYCNGMITFPFYRCHLLLISILTKRVKCMKYFCLFIIYFVLLYIPLACWIHHNTFLLLYRNLLKCIYCHIKTIMIDVYTTIPWWGERHRMICLCSTQYVTHRNCITQTSNSNHWKRTRKYYCPLGCDAL